ncbi:MAG: hypothetical protein CL678_11830 [Bdellovibrionaceae bacterium]|nr:hypothetical protein [Pseudobdellovibrionaceae bacterium]|tara:strand:+ start:4084 stop:4551 length:468 start_codon:yes stop_codon:yes gene_type:complete
MSKYEVQCRQLQTLGSSSIEALNIELGKEIVADPNQPGHAILSVELSIKTKLKDNGGFVPWSTFSQAERIFIRDQMKRLRLKRLPNQQITDYGQYGLCNKTELLKFIQRAAGGVCCYELFREYPDAHKDILSLLQSKQIVNYGTDLWDGETTFST